MESEAAAIVRIRRGRAQAGLKGTQRYMSPAQRLRVGIA
jgi:hypothetical protein